MSIQLPLNAGCKEGFFTVEVATMNHDLTRIATVINTAYKKVRYLQNEVERVTSAEVLNFISNPKKKFYLCLSPNREICGTILLDFFEKDKAEIALFAIHPESQGYKIGPAFMNYVEQEAFKNVQTIILKVIPLFQENLIRFYERLGYKATGETRDFPAEDALRYIRPDCRSLVFFSILQKNKIRSPL